MAAEGRRERKGAPYGVRGRSGQKGQGGPGSTEDGFGVGIEPLLEDGAVYLAEVGGVGEVLVLLHIEVGRLADEGGSNRFAHDEKRGGGAMVGAGTGIFGRAAAKFGEGHGEDLVVQFMSDEVFLKGGEAGRQLPHEPRMSAGLVGVGIVTGVADNIDPGFHTGCNEACHPA